eukprot:GDKI01040964.1.p3 GENE.GDKI01040964.1~~GDKI01040964.1.p3  ORF type:complete len:103 (-),score=46.44 GDKI01040964.1:245-553(-)
MHLKTQRRTHTANTHSKHTHTRVHAHTHIITCTIRLCVCVCAMKVCVRACQYACMPAWSSSRALQCAFDQAARTFVCMCGCVAHLCCCQPADHARAFQCVCV